MLFRHKFTKRRNAACHRKGGHTMIQAKAFPETSENLSWQWQCLTSLCLVCEDFFYFWLRRLSTGEEWRMIASIRILVWRRECRRNMLIRHWHFLFPPTTEIHTLKIYITLYTWHTHDWPAHNIGNPRKGIMNTRQSELFDTLSTIPKWGWVGVVSCPTRWNLVGGGDPI